MAHPYYGTPSGCPAHCTPSAMYLAHPYYGTTYTPFRRPVQTPRSDAPARTAPHTEMALGRGCSLQSGVGESPTL